MGKHRRGGTSHPPVGDPASDGATPVRRGSQPGAVRHAEGEHGPKTHARIVEQLHQGAQRESRDARLARERRKAALDGKRRLVEPREQHDVAELNSERSQLFRAYQRGGLENGPADNSGMLHGVFGHKGHRADNKLRGPDGLRVSRRRRED